MQSIELEIKPHGSFLADLWVREAAPSPASGLPVPLRAADDEDELDEEDLDDEDLDDADDDDLEDVDLDDEDEDDEDDDDEDEDEDLDEDEEE